MSLTMMALRIASVQALKLANTFVGSNVLDSQISAIDQSRNGQLQTNQERPFIAVYSNSAKTGELGNVGLRGNGRIDLLFNFGVSMAMSQTNDDDGQSHIVEGIPATDAQFEAILDLVGNQISRCLTDAQNPWAQVFGDLCTVASKEQVRSSSTAESVRLACGQLRLTVDGLADPEYGAQLAENGPWARLLTLMSENAVPQLPLFEQGLGVQGTAPADNYEALTGMSRQSAVSLKLYSIEGVASGVSILDVTTEPDPT